MKDESPNLDAKHDTALAALLSTRTVKDAAKKCGMSETTIWRFLQLPEFQGAYRAARRQLVETAISQLQRDCTDAANALRQIVKDKKAPASSRVMAARTILEQSINAIEIMDLQERMDSLESKLKEMSGRKLRSA